MLGSYIYSVTFGNVSCVSDVRDGSRIKLVSDDIRDHQMCAMVAQPKFYQLLGLTQRRAISHVPSIGLMKEKHRRPHAEEEVNLVRATPAYVG